MSHAIQGENQSTHLLSASCRSTFLEKKSIKKTIGIPLNLFEKQNIDLCEKKEFLQMDSETYRSDPVKQSSPASLTIDLLASVQFFKSKKRGFFIEALDFWGLIQGNLLGASLKNTSSVLTANGRNAFFDMHKALILYEIFLYHLHRRLVFIEKELNQLNMKPLQELKQSNVRQIFLTLSKEKKELNGLKQEAKEGMNDTMLHFILMELNSNMNDRLFFHHPIKTEEKTIVAQASMELASMGQKLMSQKNIGQKWLLPDCLDPHWPTQEKNKTMPCVEHPFLHIINTLEKTEIDSNHASAPVSDALREKIIKRIALNVALDFEQLALKQEAKKNRLVYWKPKQFTIHPNKPPHKAIHTIATHLGAFMYDIASSVFSKSFHLEKEQFIKDRGITTQHSWPSLWPILQLLIQGVLFSGEGPINETVWKTDGVRKIIRKSMDEFKDQLFYLKEEEKHAPSKLFLSAEIAKILKREQRIHRSPD